MAHLSARASRSNDEHIKWRAHADNLIDLQEFMVMPVKCPTMGVEAIRIGAEIFRALRKALSEAGHNTNGDEGGFGTKFKFHADEALQFIMRAIESAGCTPGDDVCVHSFGLRCHRIFHQWKI